MHGGLGGLHSGTPVCSGALLHANLALRPCRQHCWVELHTAEGGDEGLGGSSSNNSNVRIPTAHLHVYSNNSGGRASERQPTVPPQQNVVQVPVGQFLEWLGQYEDDNHVDLVVKRVNGGCSRAELERCLADLAQQSARDQQQHQGGHSRHVIGVNARLMPQLLRDVLDVGESGKSAAAEGD